MEVHSKWYDDIARSINSHKDTLSKKDYKKYKLDLLLRVAKRVAGFSSECGECQLFQPEIANLSKELSDLVQMSKEKRKSYLKTINTIIKHLQKTHKLATEGQKIGIWIAIGVGIGAAIGAALDNPGIGTAIGVAIGVAIGAGLDAKAKKEGKVI